MVAKTAEQATMNKRPNFPKANPAAKPRELPIKI